MGVGIDLAPSGHGAGEPHVAPDDAAVPDERLPAQDGGAGVDDHVVADVRVALDALGQGAVRVHRKALCPQGHPLVQLHILPDDGGLPDDHPGSMVDEEVRTDGGAGVNVDARLPVGLLRQEPRQQRHLQ